MVKVTFTTVVLTVTNMGVTVNREDITAKKVEVTFNQVVLTVYNVKVIVNMGEVPGDKLGVTIDKQMFMSIRLKFTSKSSGIKLHAQ